MLAHRSLGVQLGQRNELSTVVGRLMTEADAMLLPVQGDSARVMSDEEASQTQAKLQTIGRELKGSLDSTTAKVQTTQTALQNEHRTLCDRDAGCIVGVDFCHDGEQATAGLQPITSSNMSYLPRRRIGFTGSTSHISVLSTPTRLMVRLTSSTRKPTRPRGSVQAQPRCPTAKERPCGGCRKKTLS